MGKLIRESIRKFDIACRYGGEELTLILPELSLVQTSIKAEELRRAIAQLTAIYDNQPVGKITASLGVSFPQHGIVGNALLQAADTALYCAKAAGRNQVAIATAVAAIAL